MKIKKKLQIKKIYIDKKTHSLTDRQLDKISTVFTSLLQQRAIYFGKNRTHS